MEFSGQLQAPATLPQRKRTWYSLDRGLGGLQSRSGHSSEKRKIPAGYRIPIIQPV